VDEERARELVEWYSSHNLEEGDKASEGGEGTFCRES
jgi:hypothetical protein